MNFRKKLALLLALTMLILPLAVTSCGDDTGPTGPIGEVEDSSLSPAFGGEHLTFDNESFIVLTRQDRNKGQAFNIIDLVAEDNLGDSTIVDAVEKRNSMIEQNFRVKIVREKTGSSNNADVANEASSAIEKQDYTYDAFMVPVRSGLTLALNGTLVDYSDAEYIDLSSPWWDQAIINNLVLFGGTYIALGDINIVDNDATWCVLFNKELLETFGTTDAQLYAKVKEGIDAQGGWTTEYMTQLAKSSYRADENYKNKYETTYSGSGTYGIFLQTQLATVLMHASGNTPTIKSDGRAGVESNFKTPEFQDTIDAIYSFMGNKDSADWYLNIDNVSYSGGDKWQDVARGGFMANKAAFFMCHCGTIDLIREMKTDFGIIPIPKLSDTQEKYGNTIQYENGQCYIVPYRLDDELNEKSCYMLEAMAYYSSTEYDETGCLSYAFYTLCLQAKGTRDDDAWDMLDLIFDCRVFDLACALNLSGINGIIEGCTTGSNNNWVSQRDGYLSNLDGEISKSLEVLAKG